MNAFQESVPGLPGRAPVGPYRVDTTHPAMRGVVVAVPLLGTPVDGLRAVGQSHHPSFPTTNDSRAHIVGDGRFVADLGGVYTNPSSGAGYVSAPWAPILASGQVYAWTMWVRFDATPTGEIIWSNGSSVYVLYVDSTTIFSNNAGLTSWTYNVPAGKWVHLAFEHDYISDEKTLWVDGVLQSTQSGAGGSPYMNTIGGYTSSFTFRGRIHSAFQYKRGLSLDEVRFLADPSRCFSVYERIDSDDVFFPDVAVGGGVPPGMLSHRGALGAVQIDGGMIA